VSGASDGANERAERSGAWWSELLSGEALRSGPIFTATFLDFWNHCETEGASGSCERGKGKGAFCDREFVFVFLPKYVVDSASNEIASNKFWNLEN